MNSISSFNEAIGTLLLRKDSKNNAAAELQDLPCAVTLAAA